MSDKDETALSNEHTPLFANESGPIKEVHAFWLAGMSCDGCSIAAVGAKNPSVEQLINQQIPGLPKIILHHPVLAVEAGHRFMEPYYKAVRGELGATYVVLYEGSVADEDIAKETGGYFSAMGAQFLTDEDGELLGDGSWRPYPTADMLDDLAPGAAAVIAVGTCAAWGGVPAAVGNVTNAMGVMDFLGKDYRSALGLPVVNVPGCSPIGDNITETITAVLMFLAGVGPLPEFDELGRPAWMFNETVHRGCPRAGSYEEGVFADEYGQQECLVELGCWGPVVQCNIARRGALGHNGGCMNVGGICIGCTMPGFPDAFAPFYKAPPGKLISGTASRMVGSFIRPLRKISQRKGNMTNRWLKTESIPSGWGHVEAPGIVMKTIHYFYKKIQTSGTPFHPSGTKQQQKLQLKSRSAMAAAVKRSEERAKETAKAEELL
jgi:hydrogenase small subunit